jgi:hypothetical protein
MKIFAIFCVLGAWTVPIWAEGPQADEMDAMKKNDPPAVVHWARGEAHGSRGGGGSPDMTWHGGGVLSSIAVQAIFWGTSWQTSSFIDKISGLDSWYSGVKGSLYARTNGEYPGSGNTQFNSSYVSYSGHLIDFSAGPTKAPATSTILTEVCNEVKNPVVNGYYPVYVDLKRGHVGYCAWHSWGSCGSTPIQFGFFFNLDGDAGCDPQDTSTGHSQGLAALANVTGHEFSETITDPRGMSWYDSQGAENGDKCAWTFSGTPVTLGGIQWKIQGNWSNAANDANPKQGYANGGCIDGNGFLAAN